VIDSAWKRSVSTKWCVGILLFHGFNNRDLSLSKNHSTRTKQIMCLMSSDYAHVSPIAYSSPENQALDPVAHIGNRSSTVHTPANTLCLLSTHDVAMTLRHHGCDMT
jgi:hypothetical protein